MIVPMADMGNVVSLATPAPNVTVKRERRSQPQMTRAIIHGTTKICFVYGSFALSPGL